VDPDQDPTTHLANRLQKVEHFLGQIKKLRYRTVSNTVPVISNVSLFSVLLFGYTDQF
jgi:hypothetical protein